MIGSRGVLIFAFLSILTPQAINAQTNTTGVEITQVLFSELEKQIMKRYFGVDSVGTQEGTEKNTTSKGKGKKSNKGKKKGLPPGLAKRKELPPGLAKQKSLPPGLAKRELPEHLEDQLPKSAPGTERVIIEDSVILIEKATSKVLDILENVVLGNS